MNGVGECYFGEEGAQHGHIDEVYEAGSNLADALVVPLAKVEENILEETQRGAYGGC